MSDLCEPWSFRLVHSVWLRNQVPVLSEFGLKVGIVKEERFRNAWVLRDSGKDAEALREFEALSGLASDDSERRALLLQQANCLWRLNRTKGARDRLSEAEALGTNPSAELMDARLCIAEGNPDEAVRRLLLFSRGYAELKHSPEADTYVDAQEELGRLLVDLRRYAQAVEPLRDALSVGVAEEKQRRRLCFYLGICYFNAERWHEAEEQFTESLPADHQDAWWGQAQYYLGICHYENGNLGAAEQTLVKSLPPDRQDPLWSKTQYQLGRVYFKQGAYVKAQKAFELCRFFVDDVELQTNISRWLAETRVRLGQSSERPS